MITFKNVTKTFGKSKMLEDISLRIEPGECVCLLGPSGSGKSVLLSLLIGAVAPTSGTVEIDGIDVQSVPLPVLNIFRRRTGILFRDGKLIKGRTVFENVAFPLEIAGESDAVIASRVETLLKRFELIQKAQTLTAALSANEVQRTALARAMALEPLILIADEPTGNLDPAGTLSMTTMLREIHQTGVTVIVATHTPDVAEKLGARIMHLENGRIALHSAFVAKQKPEEARTVTPAQHKIFQNADPALKEKARQQRAPMETVQKKIKITPISS